MPLRTKSGQTCSSGRAALLQKAMLLKKRKIVVGLERLFSQL